MALKLLIEFKFIITVYNPSNYAWLIRQNDMALKLLIEFKFIIRVYNPSNHAWLIR